MDGLLKDATRPPGGAGVVGEKDQAGSGPDAAREIAERHALERAHRLD